MFTFPFCLLLCWTVTVVSLSSATHSCWHAIALSCEQILQTRCRSAESAEQTLPSVALHCNSCQSRQKYWYRQAADDNFEVNQWRSLPSLPWPLQQWGVHRWHGALHGDRAVSCSRSLPLHLLPSGWNSTNRKQNLWISMWRRLNRSGLEVTRALCTQGPVWERWII